MTTPTPEMKPLKPCRVDLIEWLNGSPYEQEIAEACAQCPNRAPSPVEAELRECVWTEDANDDGVWYTKCGEAFVLTTSDKPTTHGMKFCCYCGKKLTEAKLDAGEKKEAGK